jgi:hypothetical protein
MLKHNLRNVAQSRTVIESLGCVPDAACGILHFRVNGSAPTGRNRLRHNIVSLPTTNSVAYRLQNWTPGTLGESDFNAFWNRNGNVLFETRSDDKSPFRKWTFADWQRAGHDRHSVTADPQFRSSKDYGDLLPASPAKRMGFVSISLDSVGMRGRAEDAPPM